MGGVETIFTNGSIWPGRGRPRAEAVAVSEGLIVALGSSEKIEELAGPTTRRIDLGGRLLTPGLIDSHLHLLPLGANLLALDVRGTRGLDDLLSRIAERAVVTPPGQWIKVVGHDDQLLDARRHPTLEELDAAAPRNPVYLLRTCGHIYICNSAALALAGIDENTPAPAGGVIERRDGRLTGMIAETTRDMIKAALPRRTLAELVDAVLAGGQSLAAMGITGVMEAGVGRMTGDYREFEAFTLTADDGRLPLRVCMAITTGPSGLIDQVKANGFRPGDGSELAWVGPAKFHVDGSAGGGTAAMSAPYSDDCGCGVLIHDDESFHEALREQHDDGFQIAIHAIGDRAIEQVIQTFARIDKAGPVAGRRHRIEHCGFSDGDQIAAMRRFGLIPSPQPVFMHDFGEAYVRMLGEERAAGAYPIRRWIDAGLCPAVGTDAPVCLPDPMTNIYAMLTRETREGMVVGPEERVDIETALWSYTEAGAYAQLHEGRRGVLEVGKDADLAVFSQDFSGDAAADLVRETKCDLTMVGGRIVHDRRGEAS